MIHDKDRSGWFGASDSHKIINPNHTTKTWQEWWRVKLGIEESAFQGNIYTEAGARFEHPILECFDKSINLDRQLTIEDKLLRVNYDGDKDGNIFEVKTHKADKGFEITPYIEAQVQTQMYVWMEKASVGEVPPFKDLYILSYALKDEDYRNEKPTVEDIDFDRIKVTKVKYKPRKIKRFLKCLLPLVEELKNAKE
jgi:hypothetical protein